MRLIAAVPFLFQRNSRPIQQSSPVLHWDLHGRRGAVHLRPYFRLARRQPRQSFRFSYFIKARTRDLAAAPASAASPAPIVIELSNDMVRVSAISLGHPRLAIINGKAVTEGDAVTLQAPKSSIGVTLRIVRIGDGSIDLSDGRKMFSARLTIPSPPKPKAP